MLDARILSQHRAPPVANDGLWASLAIVEVTHEIIDRACRLTESQGLRGYDAIHLAAGRRDTGRRPDERRCEALYRGGGARHERRQPARDRTSRTARRRDRRRHRALRDHDRPRSRCRHDGHIRRLRHPAAARRATADPDRAGFTLAVDVGAIQGMVDFYRDWMAIHGWIFDADFGNSDPYAMEEQPFAGGYFAQLFFTKPTTPPTTVGIVIGNADGRPGHKPDLTISIAQIPTTNCRDAHSGLTRAAALRTRRSQDTDDDLRSERVGFRVLPGVEVQKVLLVGRETGHEARGRELPRE